MDTVANKEQVTETKQNVDVRTHLIFIDLYINTNYFLSVNGLCIMLN